VAPRYWKKNYLKRKKEIIVKSFSYQLVIILVYVIFLGATRNAAAAAVSEPEFFIVPNEVDSAVLRSGEGSADIVLRISGDLPSPCYVHNGVEVFVDPIEKQIIIFNKAVYVLEKVCAAVIINYKFPKILRNIEFGTYSVYALDRTGGRYYLNQMEVSYQ